jgi:hypothetical protein
MNSGAPTTGIERLSRSRAGRAIGFRSLEGLFAEFGRT